MTALAPATKEGAEPWPPPPHDPRERELVLARGAWEARIFGDRRFAYFVRRGLWHVQLWHPSAPISALTPSRLTLRHYEAFPIAGWKARQSSFDAMAWMLANEAGVEPPALAWVERIERSLVDEVVRAATTPSRTPC